MDFYEVIEKRRTIRDFEDEAIPDEVLERIRRVFKKSVLGYTEDYFMPCFIGIGRPQKGILPIKQKDIDLKQRIHWDKW